jgi:hypothetical protein
VAVIRETENRLDFLCMGNALTKYQSVDISTVTLIIPRLHSKRVGPNQAAENPVTALVGGGLNPQKNRMKTRRMTIVGFNRNRGMKFSEKKAREIN